jgi:protocatechuate 3,4-dioxygenase beta subunit
MQEHDHLEDHDRGLNHDLEVMATRTLARRKLLSLFAVGGTGALIAACGGGGSSSTGTTSTASTTTTTTTTGTTTTGTTTTTTGTTTTSSCVADPTETNGPYPSDGTNTVSGVVSNSLTTSGVVRSDIRSSFGSYSGTADGVLLTLKVKVVNTNSSCANLSGYAVYVWHCDALGRYSLYSSGVTSQNYLRGVQVTDSNGEVTFTTIWPACYDGRWPHIHFEIFPSLATATTQRNAALTSQFAMPSAVCTTIYNGSSLYSASISNFAKVSVTTDGVFGDNTTAQIAAMTPTVTGSLSAGYAATVTVGVAV